MFKHLIARLSGANVVATLALFFALGGIAIVGASNWITGADIRDQGRARFLRHRTPWGNGPDD